MTTALPAPRQLQFVDGYLDVARRLHQLGVTIAHTPLVGEKAHWDPHTTTLHLHEDAPLEQSLRVLVDMWMHIVIGPHASVAQPRRHLHLVP